MWPADPRRPGQKKIKAGGDKLMLRINQLKLPVGHTAEQLKKKIIKTLQIRECDLKQYSVRKRSIDARKKPELYYVYSLDLAVADEARVLKHAKGRVQKVTEKQI